MISILGCSGVGKSTVIGELASLLPESQVLNEDIDAIRRPINQTAFKDRYERFIATQGAFLSRDIAALELAGPTTIFDNRLAEYVFFLLHHPEFTARRSESARRLEEKILTVLGNEHVRPFYLTDDLTSIAARVKSDHTRRRSSWAFFVENMLPYHELWHREQGATVIEVGEREPIQIASEILAAI